jgi:hypothetical protein
MNKDLDITGDLFVPSGYFMVGTDTYLGATSPQNGTQAADAGFAVETSGVLQVGRYQNSPVRFNRMGNDGAIAEFKKDGTSVGWIQTSGGDIGLVTVPNARTVFIGGANSGGSARYLNFDLDVQAGGSSSGNEGGAFFPSVSDVTDLGTSNNRFYSHYLKNATYYGTINSDQFVVGKSGADNRIWDRSGGNIEFLTGDLQRFIIKNSEVVVNDDSYDVNFRVESNGNSNAFIVDASQDNVGIGGTPNVNTKLDVYQPVTTNQWTGRVVSRSNTAAVWLGTYTSGNQSTSGIYAHDAALTAWADLYINTHGDGSGGTSSGGTGQTIHSVGTWSHNGNMVINDASFGSYDFRVESDGNTHALFVNAGANEVGIGLDPAGGKGSVLVTEGGSSKFGAEISTDAEAYALSSSSKVQYSPAGTAMRIYNRSASTPATGALIDFLAYGGASGTTAQNVFLGAVGTSTGSSNTANLVFGRRTGTTAWGEMARFDPNGTFIHGNTAHSWSSNSTALFNAGGIGTTSNSDWGLQMAGSTTQRIRFFTSNGGSGATVGSVTVSASSTSYSTSSDHRLKENVVDLTGATERLKQLEPKRFNFIADADTTVDGFLAHEAQTVVPEAVTGTHNEVDDEGNPVYQGIDQAKLVPLLTAALQEAITKIEDLEARIATLEG